jgi:hypothetical protein
MQSSVSSSRICLLVKDNIDKQESCEVLEYLLMITRWIFSSQPQEVGGMDPTKVDPTKVDPTKVDPTKVDSTKVMQHQLL